MASRKLGGLARFARGAGRSTALVLLGLGLLHCSGDAPREGTGKAAAATTTECRLPTVHYQLRVIAKSYIASLRESFSPTADYGAPPLPYNDGLFSDLAAATAIAYHEDPSPRAGCDPQGLLPFFDNDSCRLRVQAEFTVACRGKTLVQFDRTSVSEAAGHEGPLEGVIAKAFAKARIETTPTGSTLGTFAVLVYGHPAAAAEPAFQAVRPRENIDIWNHSSGTVKCTSTGLLVGVGAVGSKFPSHRVWVQTLQGAKPPHEIAFSQRAQGRFGDLWSLEPVPNL